MRIALFSTLTMIIACGIGFADEPQIRTWTATSGKKMEATLVKTDGGKVVLKQKNGAISRINIAHLSEQDVQYLADRQTGAAKADTAKKLSELGWKHGQQEVALPEALKDGQTLGPTFYLFIPESYGSEASGSPFILFLHGAGERGADVKMIKRHGIPQLAEKQKPFPFVAVSPQCKAGKWWSPDELKKLVDDVVSKLEIDESRLYITGLSMGGFGTWAMIAKYPDLFAAAIPICGGGNPATAPKIKDLPVWVFHGDADNTVNISKSEEMVAALKKEKSDVKFTIYPGVGHNSWSRTYKNDEIYRWLLEQKSR